MGFSSTIIFTLSKEIFTVNMLDYTLCPACPPRCMAANLGKCTKLFDGSEVGPV